jgi:antitoxin YefM
MTVVNTSEARDNLDRLLDEAAAAHEPVLITGPRSNGVLVGEEDWNAIQETLHLLSIPGMHESIRGRAGHASRGVREGTWLVSSSFSEQIEVPFAAHASGAQQVLDDEHRNFLIAGNDKGALYTGFRVDQMITALPVKGESVLLEYSG